MMAVRAMLALGLIVSTSWATDMRRATAAQDDAERALRCPLVITVGQTEFDSAFDANPTLSAPGTTVDVVFVQTPAEKGMRVERVYAGSTPAVPVATLDRPRRRFRYQELTTGVLQSAWASVWLQDDATATARVQPGDYRVVITYSLRSRPRQRDLCSAASPPFRIRRETVFEFEDGPPWLE